MKLYYSTGSCSMSCHIALEEAGAPYTGIEVSWDKNLNVAELEKLNPLGVVPLLANDQGKTLTQNVAILEFIADSKPDSRLLPKAGTWERAEAMSWLSFVAADFHKAFVPLFALSYMSKSPEAQKEIRQYAVNSVQGYLKHIDENLVGKAYLTGNDFTVADAYLFTVLGWCKWLEINAFAHPNIKSYAQRVLARPAVKKVVDLHDMASEYA